MKLQLYALTSAAPLLTRNDLSHHATPTIVVFGAGSDDRLIWYWHPRLPKQICTIDFGDWEHCKRWGDVVLAKRFVRNTEWLLWHLALGCGVRTHIADPPQQGTTMHFTHGTFFMQSQTALRLVIAAVPMIAEPVPPTARRSVPADLTFVSARTVYDGTDLAPMTPVATVSRDGLEAPLFARSMQAEVWGL